MDLSNIRLRFKNKKLKRVGRGVGSGHGKTSTRGNKGAGSREGKKLPYTGFRGGNMPLARLLPKRGFNSPNPKIYQIVNLANIVKKIKNTPEIDPAALEKANLIKDKNKPVKILADIDGDFTCKSNFKADSFSAKAKQLIEKAGGKADCLKR